MTSTMAVDGEGARDDDAVSFSSDVDEPGLDADIDADDIAALLDEREAAAPDEPLALATVARRNLPDDFLHLAGPEDIARAVAKLDQVRLDRCRLASFAGPGMSIETRRASFANVTALYLQRNRLTSTEGIDGTTLPKLRFLALQGNALVSIATLGTLRKLALLDLSDNVPLAALDELVGSLPSSVRYLTCVGCGCASNDVDYREALVASLPELKRLDGADVTRGERKAAMAAFGEDLDSEEGGGGGGCRGCRHSCALESHRFDGREGRRDAEHERGRRGAFTRDSHDASDARGPDDGHRARGRVPHHGRHRDDGHTGG